MHIPTPVIEMYAYTMKLILGQKTCFDQLDHEISNTNLPSRVTHKKFLNPPVTKTYWEGSNHVAKLLHKKWSQKIRSFWRYFILKNQEIRRPQMLNYLKWLNQSVLSMDSTHMQKNSMIAQFSHDITRIQHWELFFKCQGVSAHTQVNGLNKKDVLTDFPTKRKKLTSDISSFLRQSWITVLKHFRRKWPHLLEIIH